MKRTRYGPFVGLVAVLLSMPTANVAAQEVMCPVPLVEGIPCNGFDPDEISPDYPFEPKVVDVLDSFMAYIEAGEGDPILFIHGQPTYSLRGETSFPS